LSTCRCRSVMGVGNVVLDDLVDLSIS
jgi:hypothetical protein